MDSSATGAEVSEIANHAINMSLQKLVERFFDMVEQTIIDTLKNCDSDLNKVIGRKVIWGTQQNLIATELENDARICDGFDTAVTQVVVMSSFAKEVTLVIVSETAILAPSGTNVENMADLAVNQVLKPAARAVLLPLPSSESDS